jgi:hypothetical protein
MSGIKEYSDDFERPDTDYADPQPLGPDWTRTAYSGGPFRIASGRARCESYGSMQYVHSGKRCVETSCYVCVPTPSIKIPTAFGMLTTATSMGVGIGSWIESRLKASLWVPGTLNRRSEMGGYTGDVYLFIGTLVSTVLLPLPDGTRSGTIRVSLQPYQSGQRYLHEVFFNDVRYYVSGYSVQAVPDPNVQYAWGIADGRSGPVEMEWWNGKFLVDGRIRVFPVIKPDKTTVPAADFGSLPTGITKDEHGRIVNTPARHLMRNAPDNGVLVGILDGEGGYGMAYGCAYGTGGTA